MQGIDSKYINNGLYDIQYNKSNFFKDYKEQELRNEKMNVWGNASSYIINEDQPEGQFSAEFVFKHICMFSDEEWKLNERLRKKELNAIKGVSDDDTFDPRGYDVPGVVMQQQADAQAEGSIEAEKAKEEPKESEQSDEKQEESED